MYSTDKIMRQRKAGPALEKDRLREGLTQEDARTELNKVERLLDKKNQYEEGIKNVDIEINEICAKYNLAGLNHLLAVLRRKS